MRKKSQLKTLPVKNASSKEKKSFLLTLLETSIALGLIFGIYKLAILYRNITTPTPPLAPIPTPTASLTPAPPKTIEKIKIIEGNVCLVKPDGEAETLVNKESFKAQAITGFAQVKVSPDKTKMCFLGYAPAQIWLYHAKIDGSGIVRIGLAKNCVWSEDSLKIAYNNHAVDVSPVDVYVYDTATSEVKNLTKGKAEEGLIRFYELPRWFEKDQKIASKFVRIEGPLERKKEEGFSVIDLLSGEITDYEWLPPIWPF